MTVLPMGDPAWAARCEPLRVFLASPKTWEELEAWRRERKVGPHMLPQMLAWLDGKKLARYEGRKWRSR